MFGLDVWTGSNVARLEYIDKVLREAQQAELAKYVNQSVRLFDEIWKSIVETHLDHLDSEQARNEFSRQLKRHRLLETQIELADKLYELCTQVEHDRFDHDPPAKVLLQIRKACQAAIERGHRLSEPSKISIELGA